MDKQRQEIIIIGSGPAGYTAAIYAARAGLNPLVLAGAIDAGGALMTTTEVENFPGFPKGVLGPDLMDSMREQAERFGAQIIFDDVTEVALEGDVKTVCTFDSRFEAKAVVVATGSAYRKLNVPGEEEFSGRGVSYCATCDGAFFKDQPLAVIGGGDSAMEEATFLARFASHVVVVHRRDQLRASKVMAQRAMDNPKISFAWDSVVTRVVGDETVTGLVLKNTKTGAESTLDVKGVFVAVGHDPRSSLFAGQLDLEDGYIKVDMPSTATSVRGVFACGDVVDHSYRQAVTAAGSGCKAGLDAIRFLESSRD